MWECLGGLFWVIVERFFSGGSTGACQAGGSWSLLHLTTQVNNWLHQDYMKIQLGSLDGLMLIILGTT